MTDGQKRRLEYVRERVPLRVALYERCFTGKASLAARIKAMCIDCMGVNLKLAKSCPTDWCPLWGGRPSTWVGGRKKKAMSAAQVANTESLSRNRAIPR